VRPDRRIVLVCIFIAVVAAAVVFVFQKAPVP
jgi:hypothetical protein